MAEQQTHTRHIYTVTSLTGEIKSILEDTFSFVWISGEISNLSTPSSGHTYFTLKDDAATIQGVLFRQQKKNLKFTLENGMTIIGMARISVYEPRGSYQLIFEYITPEGLGTCQIAFEQLKKKLSQNGLFDPERKKPIPFLPERISVITSSSGSVLRDILTVINRRFPAMPIDIYPVRVQGNGSAEQICAAIHLANRFFRSSVIILARGGGSLEDLQAFNSENVALAISGSRLPVISAVGHETDFTIADFAADLRAPTPSAAAELAVPERDTCVQSVITLTASLRRSVFSRIDRMKSLILQLESRLKSPKKTIDGLRLKTIDLESRTRHAVSRLIKGRRDQLSLISHLLASRAPKTKVSDYETRLSDLSRRLFQSLLTGLSRNREHVLNLESILVNLNPKALLKKGYSITYLMPANQIVTCDEQTAIGDRLDILLSEGKLVTRIIKKNGKEKNI